MIRALWIFTDHFTDPTHHFYIYVLVRKYTFRAPDSLGNLPAPSISIVVGRLGRFTGDIAVLDLCLSKYDIITACFRVKSRNRRLCVGEGCGERGEWKSILF